MKERIFHKLILLIMVFAFIQLSGISSQNRFALVIGNGNYSELASLRNSRNDAQDISSALKDLGFEVNLLQDADLVTMENALIQFSNKLSVSSDAIGLFYYAGHSVQSQGINYLIPSDAHIPGEAFLRTKSLSLQAVLDTLGNTHDNLNIVILDACRDNPFGWGRGGSRGLSVVSAQPPGSIVVYATSAGSIALDGEGRNGVFTGELLKNLRTPGLDIKEIFDRTGQSVQQVTSGQQNPAVYSQFFGKFYLAGYVSSDSTGINPPIIQPAIPSSIPPSMSIKKSYGKVSILTKDSGTLYLDGNSIGKLPEHAIATINEVESGFHLFQMHYDTGPVEEISAYVANDTESSVTFNRSYIALTIPGTNVQIVFSLIPSGTFLMGSPIDKIGKSNDEGPQHEVSISKPFYLSIYEITQAQWLAVMGTNPSGYTFRFDSPFLPVECVSWEDAQQFINKLNKLGIGSFRLPTEAEWEYACRAGSQNEFPWGDDQSLAEEYAWYYFTSGWSPNPVGSKKPNAWGIYDMIGNILEWCADWYGPYSKNSQIDPKGPKSGSSRVLRGGDWTTSKENDLRSARRYYDVPTKATTSIGFRIVRNAP